MHALAQWRKDMPEMYMHANKLFKLQVCGGPHDGEATQMGDYELAYGNAYVSIYGAVEAGYKQPHELEVGESTLKIYALSGQKPTTYRLVRVA